MAEEVSALKKWMRKQDIYDVDLEGILVDQNIKDPEKDFDAYSEAQFDELYRRAVVERAKDFKDQPSKVRLEKKIVKIEKHWRKCSGIKKTSIKPGSKATDSEAKAPDDQSSMAATNDLLEKAADLKKFMQKNGCYNMDLLAVLSDHGVNKESDIATVKTNMEFNTITREFRVLQRGKLKDNDAKMRSDKTLAKYEKIWRKQTGLKNTSIKADSKGSNKETPKDAKNKELAGKGKKIKDWMKKNSIWEKTLYEELIANGVLDPEQLKDLKEKKFDEIVRKVRVDRFSQLKDQQARNRADKLLIAFEKKWRKASGIKKTSIKKK